MGLVEAEHFEAERMAGVEHGEGALVGNGKIAVVDLRGKKAGLRTNGADLFCALRLLMCRVTVSLYGKY